MGKIAIYTILWIISMVSYTHAQPVVSGKVGPAFSRFHLDTEQPSVVERKYRTAISAGMALHLRTWQPFIPQMEVLFTTKGSRYEVVGEPPDERSLDYLQLIPLFRAEAASGIVALYGLAGLDVDILLAAKSINAFGVGTDITDGLPRIDFGVTIGGGAAIGPLSWGTVTVEARYGLGLVDLDDAGDSSTTNRTISIMLGYEYRRDRDGDGIPDGKDGCPREAEDRDGFEDADGCPDPDNDGDGVADREDLCPDEPAAQSEGRLRGCSAPTATRTL